MQSPLSLLEMDWQSQSLVPHCLTRSNFPTRLYSSLGVISNFPTFYNKVESCQKCTTSISLHRTSTRMGFFFEGGYEITCHKGPTLWSAGAHCLIFLSSKLFTMCLSQQFVLYPTSLYSMESSGTQTVQT